MTTRATPAPLVAVVLAATGVIWACLLDPRWMEHDGDHDDIGECTGYPKPTEPFIPCEGLDVDIPCKPGWERDDNGICSCPRGYELDPITKQCRWAGGSGSPGNPRGPGSGDPGSGGGGGGGGPDDDDWPNDDTGDFEVKIRCTGSGIRTEEIHCKAETRNGQGETTFKWTFSPRDGGPLIWDSGGVAPQLKLPDVKHTETTSADTSSWTGMGVQGGIVSVEARDTSGGPSVSQFTSFDVWERGGTWQRLPKRLHLRKETPNIDSAFTSGDPALFGYNADVATGSDSTQHILQGQGTAGFDRVRGGPNDGYWYTTGHGYDIDRMWNINSRIDTLGPREIIDTTHGDTIDAWTFLKRKGHDPAKMKEAVAAHETYGHNGQSGHQSQLDKTISTRACGAVGSLVERIVTKDRHTAEVVAEVLENSAAKALALAASHHYVYGNASAEKYVVRNVVPDTFFVDSWSDLQQPKPNVTLHYPAWCDWTTF